MKIILLGISSNGYLTSDQVNMIEDNTTWYLGYINWRSSYKLAKYATATGDTLTSDTTKAKIGLLRAGELMAGQIDKSANNIAYFILTPYYYNPTERRVQFIRTSSYLGNSINDYYGIKPALNLKSNIVIAGGKGTKQEPFSIELK